MFQPRNAPSYMQELDQWTEENVIGPQVDPQYIESTEERDAMIARVKRAIREKVLESYHNGQAAGPSKGRRYDTR